MLIVSCSEDKNLGENNTNNGISYPVEFNMTTMEVVDFPVKTRVGQTTDASIMRSYFLYIYDNAGDLVMEKVNENANEATAKLKLQLPVGNYTAVLVAFNEEDGTVQSFGRGNLNNNAGIYNYHKRSITVSEPWEEWYTYPYNFNTPYNNDYFYKKVNFSVAGTANVEMIATRITGRLHLTYKDIETGDSNIAYNFVRIKFENLPYGVNFINDGFKESKYDEYYYLTKSQWKEYAARAMVVNCMASTTAPKIILDFCKSQYNFNYITEDDIRRPIISYTRTIEGFSVFQNKITKLTGNVFDNTTFTISIDTNWDGEVIGEF